MSFFVRQSIGIGELSTRGETLTENNGQPILVMKTLTLGPGENGYAWAVKDYIEMKSSLWCEI